MHQPPYGPPDAMKSPRYSGLRSFMRLPHTTDLRGVDFRHSYGVPLRYGWHLPRRRALRPGRHPRRLRHPPPLPPRAADRRIPDAFRH